MPIRALTRRVACFALLAAGAAGFAVAHAPVPEPQVVRGEQCVAPTDVMRRDHMDFLHHQRDATVIEGLRTPRFSLERCVGCHADKDASGTYLRVDAPGQFCSTCHEYAAVELDCFGCHAARPYQDENAGIDARFPFHGLAFRQPHAGRPGIGATGSVLHD